MLSISLAMLLLAAFACASALASTALGGEGLSETSCSGSATTTSEAVSVSLAVASDFACILISLFAFVLLINAFVNLAARFALGLVALVRSALRSVGAYTAAAALHTCLLNLIMLPHDLLRALSRLASGALAQLQRLGTRRASIESSTRNTNTNSESASASVITSKSESGAPHGLADERDRGRAGPEELKVRSKLLQDKRRRLVSDEKLYSNMLTKVFLGKEKSTQWRRDEVEERLLRTRRDFTKKDVRWLASLGDRALADDDETRLMACMLVTHSVPVLPQEGEQLQILLRKLIAKVRSYDVCLDRTLAAAAGIFDDMDRDASTNNNADIRRLTAISAHWQLVSMMGEMPIKGASMTFDQLIIQQALYASAWLDAAEKVCDQEIAVRKARATRALASASVQGQQLKAKPRGSSSSKSTQVPSGGVGATMMASDETTQRRVRTAALEVKQDAAAKTLKFQAQAKNTAKFRAVESTLGTAAADAAAATPDEVRRLKVRERRAESYARVCKERARQSMYAPLEKQTHIVRHAATAC